MCLQHTHTHTSVDIDATTNIKELQKLVMQRSRIILLKESRETMQPFYFNAWSKMKEREPKTSRWSTLSKNHNVSSRALLRSQFIFLLFFHQLFFKHQLVPEAALGTQDALVNKIFYPPDSTHSLVNQWAVATHTKKTQGSSLSFMKERPYVCYATLHLGGRQ